MQITKVSIKRSTLVVVVFTVLFVLGAFSYKKLSYELLPKFSSPIITISTLYPGAAPTEVENSVTKVLEDAVSALENVDAVRSTSYESYSVIVIELVSGTDVDLSLQDAQRKVNAVLADLPDDADPPTLGKFDLDELPIMRLASYSNLTPTEFYDFMDNRVVPSIARLQGVAQVNMLGGSEREIQVNVNKDKLNAYGLSILQIQQAIATSNLDFPTGKVKNDDGQILIRLAGKFSSLDQIRNLVVSEKDGAMIKIGDVANVTDAIKDTEIISRLEGKTAIGLTIQKQSDANAVEVAELLKSTLDELEKTYADYDLKFEIAMDSSEFTLEAADAVIHDLVIAILLVAAIMLLFLHSIRNAVIVMIAVPTSIIATFIMMYLAGFTLNLMTLLGLSLVVGILVDDAIVVIENIYRHMEMGKSKLQASYDGIREIGGTVTSITLVIVVVFVPLSMTGGLISGILTQFSLTVATSTMISLLVAFTMIPLLTSRFSKLEHINPKTFFGKILQGFENGLDAVVDQLVGILKWAFNHKLLVLGVTTLLFFGSLVLVGTGFIGSEFVKQGDRGEFIVQLELPKNATVEQTNDKVREVEEYLKSKEMITSVFTTIGTSSQMMGGGQSNPYLAELNIKMVPSDKRNISASDYARDLEIELEENIVGAEITSIPVSIMGTADNAPIQMVLYGPDLDTLNNFAQKVMQVMAEVPGTRKIETTVEEGNPELRVEIDRTKMANLGLDIGTVGATLQTAFSGNTDSEYRDGDYDYEINLRLSEFDRKSVTDLENITLKNNKGKLIKLKQFAEIVQSEGPSQLERKDRITSLTIESQVAGRPTGTVGNEIKEKIDQLDFPNEVSISYEGDMKNQSEAFGSLGVALLASILFVYLIMVALYDSYVYPLVVLFSLPLAIIGALLALALAKESLSIFTILGIIMLIGLVAKNAIMLVDFANQMKGKMSVQAALIEAVKIRFRPILMTTLAMIIGMLPIALAGGAGAEWKNGLAWALIGGLTSSMFLTMVVIPVIYYMFDRILARFGLDKKKSIELSEAPIVEGDGVVMSH